MIYDELDLFEATFCMLQWSVSWSFTTPLLVLPFQNVPIFHCSLRWCMCFVDGKKEKHKPIALNSIKARPFYERKASKSISFLVTFCHGLVTHSIRHLVVIKESSVSFILMRFIKATVEMSLSDVLDSWNIYSSKIRSFKTQYLIFFY